MSDPVSNMEIEDVLSSIRRLVSVKDRANSDLNKDEEPQTQVSHDDDDDIANDAELTADIDPEDVPDTSIYVESDTSDPEALAGIELGTSGAKLVLTPSLKVGDPPKVAPLDEYDDVDIAPDAEAPEADMEGADYLSETNAPFTSLGEGDDPLKSPEETSDFTKLRPEARVRDWIMRGVEDPEVDAQPDAYESDAPESLDVQSQDVQLVESSTDGIELWTQDAKDDSGQPDDVIEETASLDQNLELRIAEVEAAVAARSEQWDPDTAEQDDYAGINGAPLPWEDGPDDPAAEIDPSLEEDASGTDAVLALEQTVLNEDDALDEEDFDDEQVDPQSVPSDGLMDAQDEPQSDLIEDDDDLDDMITESVVDQTVSEAAFAVDDIVIDETALRDMVADVVRQELQGAVGERITRNIRKLIRREVHRAMRSQDYD